MKLIKEFSKQTYFRAIIVINYPEGSCLMQNNEKRELFESMPVPKAIARMAVPTIISQLISLVYNVVDTFFIGRTGNSFMVAGVTVAYTVFMMTVSFGNLFGVGGGSLMARLSGRRDEDGAKRVAAYSVYGAILIALGYSLLTGVFCDPLLKLLGASKDTITYARQYVYLVVVAGDLPIILSAVIAHLLRNAGYSRQASVGLSLGGILNIALDPLFMFVILPEGMEVFGAALATLIANAIACVFLICVYRKVGKSTVLSMNVRNALVITKEEKKALYNVGIPSAILTGLFDLANIVLNALMSKHGDLPLAALGIVMKAERLPNAINIGICQAILPIIAYNYSSGNRKRMNEVINTATFVGLGICVICVALFEIFARPVAGVFLSAKGENADAALETIGYAVLFLRLRCLASPFQFMNYRSSFCLQAMGNGRDTLLHACVRELVFYIPFMYLLNMIFGMSGLVCGLLAGEFCGMLFAVWLMNRFLNKISKEGAYLES